MCPVPNFNPTTAVACLKSYRTPGPGRFSSSQFGISHFAVIFRIFDIGNKKYLTANDLTAMCATVAALESAGLASRGSPTT